MPVVLVHGNPESDAIWAPLEDALARTDIVRLSPPGFGAPLPDDFPATYLDYRDWLEVELEKIGGPIDLVGHDWGGGHVVNAMIHRPELVRSWVTDSIGIFDPEYVWHDLARIWQTPGEGEQLVDAMMDTPVEDWVTQIATVGMTADIAAQVARSFGPDMGRAILTLYRSAGEPGAMAAAGGGLERAGARPGLSLLCTADTYVGSEEIRRRAAGRAGARTEVLEGRDHYWMIQDPEGSAALLERFWNSVG